MLRDVSFTINAGENVALVGQSGRLAASVCRRRTAFAGSGKSTIFALLQRFYDLDGGASFFAYKQRQKAVYLDANFAYNHRFCVSWRGIDRRRHSRD